MTKPGLISGFLVFYCPLRIPHHLPQMLIGILKVARVTTPEGVLSRLYDNGASAFRLLHHCIDFCLRRDVMSECEFSGTWVALRKAGIEGDALAWPDRKL
jgi:hypothetical protein